MLFWYTNVILKLLKKKDEVGYPKDFNRKHESALTINFVDFFRLDTAQRWSSLSTHFSTRMQRDSRNGSNKIHFSYSTLTLLLPSTAVPRKSGTSGVVINANDCGPATHDLKSGGRARSPLGREKKYYYNNNAIRARAEHGDGGCQDDVEHDGALAGRDPVFFWSPGSGLPG